MGGNNNEEEKSFLEGLDKNERNKVKNLLENVRRNTNNVNSNAHDTIKSLRIAANKLDALWKNCKKVYVCGTSASILGGIVTLSAIMTGGIAAPLLWSVVGVGGAAVNLYTIFVEASINSTEITKAQRDLEKMQKSIDNLEKTVQSLLAIKEGLKLLYCTTLTGQAIAKAAGRAGAKAAGQAGAKAAGQAGAKADAQAGAKEEGQAGAKAGTKLVLGVSAFFLVVDTIDLCFTIRDLIVDKGSDAASLLRQKADELEEMLIY